MFMKKALNTKQYFIVSTTVFLLLPRVLLPEPDTFQLWLDRKSRKYTVPSVKSERVCVVLACKLMVENGGKSSGSWVGLRPKIWQSESQVKRFMLE